jgi:hypothetical protein
MRFPLFLDAGRMTDLFNSTRAPKASGSGGHLRREGLQVSSMYMENITVMTYESKHLNPVRVPCP